MSVYCIINQTGRLSDPTKKLRLDEPLAYSNQRAHSFRFTVLAEGSDAPATLTGVGVTGQFLQQGATPNTTVEPILGTVNGNVCEVILPAPCYSVPGRFKFTMDIAVSSPTAGVPAFSTSVSYAIGDRVVYNSNVWVFTAAHPAGAWVGTDATTEIENRTVLWVEGIVERNTTNAAIDPGTPIPNVTVAINNANAAASAANAAATLANGAAEAAEGAAGEAIGNFAPAFAEATANAAGTYVTYTDGKMYLLPNGHTANTTWANTTKSEVKVGGELTDLRGAVNTIDNRFSYNILSANVLDLSNLKINYYIDGSGNILPRDTEPANTNVWYGKVKPNTRYLFCRKNSQGEYINFQGRVAQYDASGNVISGTVSGNTGESSYDITTTANTVYMAKYTNGIDIVSEGADAMLIENYSGTMPTEYIPFVSETILKKLYSQSPERYKKWYGCNVVFYGDSITAQGNSINLPNGEYGFQKYVREFFKPSNMYCRGVGGQKYVWNNGHWYCDANGEYTGRPGQGGLTEPPAGSTEHLACFPSWDRITASIPSAIRESIDLVVVMGGTNDIAGIEEIGDSGEFEFTEPVWVTSGVKDTAWTQSAMYLGGDYDTTKFTGGIASTLMKWKVWCPNATVILVTPFVLFENNVCYKNQYGVTFRQMCDIELQTSEYLGNPCADVNMMCNIMPFEQSTYTMDGTHPNTAGKKKLGNAVINAMMNYNEYVL